MHVCFLPCEEKCSDRETNTVSSEVHLSSSTLGVFYELVGIKLYLHQNSECFLICSMLK